MSVAKAVSGIELTEHLVEFIITLFDEDGKSGLSRCSQPPLENWSLIIGMTLVSRVDIANLNLQIVFTFT